MVELATYGVNLREYLLKRKNVEELGSQLLLCYDNRALRIDCDLHRVYAQSAKRKGNSLAINKSLEQDIRARLESEVALRIAKLYSLQFYEASSHVSMAAFGIKNREATLLVADWLEKRAWDNLYLAARHHLEIITSESMGKHLRILNRNLLDIDDIVKEESIRLVQKHTFSMEKN